MGDEFQNGAQGEVVTNTVVSDKNKLAAALLCFFLGGIGLHRFYLGYTGSGVMMIVLNLLGIFTSVIIIGWLFWIILLIWIVVDFFRILLGGLKDSQGRALQ